MAPSVLDLLGLEAPAHMVGRSVYQALDLKKAEAS
jgi:hypothetical protein